MSQDTAIDPGSAFRHLQNYVASEVARLYGEIAARDAYIEQLRASVPTPAVPPAADYVPLTSVPTQEPAPSDKLPGGFAYVAPPEDA